MHPTLNPTSELAKKLQKKDFKGNIIIAVVFTLILFASIFTAYRKHYTKSFYMLNADQATYTYKAPVTNKTTVDIPTKFKGATITVLGPWAYGDSPNLEKVVIPDSITSLGRSAFRNCSSLVEVVIPDSVVSIGEDSFLKSAYYNDESNWDGDELYLDGWLIAVKESDTPRVVEVNEGTKGIADKLFAKRKDITSVILPDSLLYLGNETFKDNNVIESVDLGDGLTFIGEKAFSGCMNLKTVDIGLNVNKISWYAFEGCLNLVEANFANPYNWYLSLNSDYSNGWPTDATSAEDFASYLADDYSYCFWYRV